MSYARLTMLVLSCTMILINSSPLSAETRYKLIDLGLHHEGESFAYGINNKSQVVGQIDDAPSLAVIWQNNEMTYLENFTHYSYAVAINDKGQPVGTLYAGGLEANAWLFHGDYGTPVFLPGSHANDINNNSIVIGSRYQSMGWVTLMKDLTTGVETPLGMSQAAGINDLNHVVGGRVLWNNGDFTYLGNLGLDSPSSTKALGINNRDEVVGYSYYKAGYYHAFRWDETNGIEDLGTLGGSYSAAVAVNDPGIMVGWAWNESKQYRAAIWNDSGQIHDLNLLAADLTGWDFLREARDINDHGEIVGFGITFDGNKHAFLMTPIGATISPESYEFENCSIGCERTISFTVENEYDESIEIESVVISPTDSEFQARNDQCAGNQIIPSGNCTFEVVFSPETIGNKTATVNVAVQDYRERNIEVAVSGLTEPCAGDFDMNGNRDSKDIKLFSESFGKTQCGSGCKGDFLNDGDVDGEDIELFLIELEYPDCQGCF